MASTIARSGVMMVMRLCAAADGKAMVLESGMGLRAELATEDEKVRAKGLHEAALAWFRDNGRTFPWRRTRDLYQILVAEVCLQKTNAAKVAPVFKEIVNKYPDVEALADADPIELRREFSGLGLFKRGDFLLQMAKSLVADYGGRVPGDKEALLRVRGIGDYTANSVLCLSRGERLPLLDGSTQRVVGRVFSQPAEKPAWANKRMRDFMQAILPEKGAREFNLALIDIADKYCRPKRPKCNDCPVRGVCLAASKIGGTSDGLQPGR